jgi:hypothetical protein
MGRGFVVLTLAAAVLSLSCQAKWFDSADVVIAPSDIAANERAVVSAAAATVAVQASVRMLGLSIAWNGAAETRTITVANAIIDDSIDIQCSGATAVADLPHGTISLANVSVAAAVTIRGCPMIALRITGCSMATLDVRALEFVAGGTLEIADSVILTSMFLYQINMTRQQAVASAGDGTGVNTATLRNITSTYYNSGAPDFGTRFTLTQLWLTNYRFELLASAIRAPSSYSCCGGLRYYRYGLYMDSSSFVNGDLVLRDFVVLPFVYQPGYYMAPSAVYIAPGVAIESSTVTIAGLSFVDWPISASALYLAPTTFNTTTQLKCTGSGQLAIVLPVGANSTSFDVALDAVAASSVSFQTSSADSAINITQLAITNSHIDDLSVLNVRFMNARNNASVTIVNSSIAALTAWRAIAVDCRNFSFRMMEGSTLTGTLAFSEWTVSRETQYFDMAIEGSTIDTMILSNWKVASAGAFQILVTNTTAKSITVTGFDLVAPRSSVIQFHNTTFGSSTCIWMRHIGFSGNTFTRTVVEISESVIGVPHSYTAGGSNYWSDSISLSGNVFTAASAFRLMGTRFTVCPLRSTGLALAMSAVIIAADNTFNASSRVIIDGAVFESLPGHVRSIELLAVFQDAHMLVRAAPSGGGLLIAGSNLIEPHRALITSSVMLYGGMMNSALQVTNVMLQNVTVRDVATTILTLNSIVMAPVNSTWFGFERVNVTFALLIDTLKSSPASAATSGTSLALAFTNVIVPLTLQLSNFNMSTPTTSIAVKNADVGALTVSDLTVSSCTRGIQLIVEDSKVFNLALVKVKADTCAAVGIIATNVFMDADPSPNPSPMPTRISFSGVSLRNYTVLFNRISLRIPFAYRTSGTVQSPAAIGFDGSTFANGAMCITDVDFWQWTSRITLNPDRIWAVYAAGTVTFAQSNLSFTALRFWSSDDDAVAWSAKTDNDTTVRFALSGRGATAFDCDGLEQGGVYSVALSSMLARAAHSVTKCNIAVMVVSSSAVTTLTIDQSRFVFGVAGGLRVLDSDVTTFSMTNSVIARGIANAVALINTTFLQVIVSDFYASAASVNAALVMHKVQTSRVSLRNVDFSAARGRPAIVLQNITISDVSYPYRFDISNLRMNDGLVQLTDIHLQVPYSYLSVSGVVPRTGLDWSGGAVRNTTVSICDWKLTRDPSVPTRQLLTPGLRIQEVAFNSSTLTMSNIDARTMTSPDVAVALDTVLLTAGTSFIFVPPSDVSTTIALDATSSAYAVRLPAGSTDSYGQLPNAVAITRDVAPSSLQCASVSSDYLQALADQSRSSNSNSSITSALNCTASWTDLRRTSIARRHTHTRSLPLPRSATATLRRERTRTIPTSAPSTMLPTARPVTTAVSTPLPPTSTIPGSSPPNTTPQLTSPAPHSRNVSHTLLAPTDVEPLHKDDETSAPSVLNAIGLDNGAVEAIQASVYGSAVIAATLSPTMANKVSGVSKVVQLLQCGTIDGDADLQPPAAVFLIPGIPIGSVDNPAQEAALEHARGILTTFLLFIVAIAASLALYGRAGAGEIHQAAVSVTVINAAMGIAIGYFSPNIVTSGMLIALHSANEVARVVGGSSVLVVAGFVGWLAWLTSRYDDEWTNPNPIGLGPRMYVLWQPLYDAARDMARWSVKLHTFEDTGVALLIAALSAIYPATVDGCRIVSGIITALALGHMVYITVLKPYRELVEQRLAVLNALLLLVASVLTLALLFADSADTGDDDWRVVVLGYTLIVLDAAFFAQAIFLAGYSLYIYAVERHGRHDSKGELSKADEALQDALLVAPALAAVHTNVAIPPALAAVEYGCTPRVNPLHAGSF